MMVCAQVIGNDATDHHQRPDGQLRAERDAAGDRPQPARVDHAAGECQQVLADKAIAGFTVNTELIAETVEKNPIMVTALNPIIGYDLAAKIAKRAYAEGRRVKEVAAEMTDLSPAELDRLLDPAALAEGGIKGGGSGG